MEKSENNAEFRFFRGNLTELGALNDPGFNLRNLTEKIVGLPGEPDKLIFKVRSQLTWFRMKHPTGRIATEVKNHDEFSAWVEATVYDSGGNLLQTANATATADRDAVNGLPLIETAESRAVSRALDFAGYGCQLDIGTFDESQVPRNDAPNGTPNSSDNGGAAAAPQQSPKKEPDAINPKMKVPANAGAEPVDISELVKSPDKKRKAKEAKENKTADAPVNSTANDASQTTAAPESAAEGAGEAAKDTGDADPMQPENTQQEAAEGATVEDKVNSFISNHSANKVEHFDERFFAGGTVDAEAFYVNASGKNTGIRNKDLQCAIAYLSANRDACEQITCPLKETSAYYGKTFGELVALGDEGKSVITMFATGYMKNNTPAYAAALIINHSLVDSGKGAN